MNSKILYGSLAVIVIGLLAFVIAQKEPEQIRPGVAHEDKGQNHVQFKEYGGEEPPTSGDHAAPLDWQVYDRDVPDANVIHNMEHGGIYISYRPDLPQDQVKKIKSLFSRPYSNASFSPTKAIVAPRAKNKSAIVMSSWMRSQKFEAFDEQAMIDYYLKNIGKSPEPGAN